jgi:hypothetical protein
VQQFKHMLSCEIEKRHECVANALYTIAVTSLTRTRSQTCADRANPNACTSAGSAAARAVRAVSSARRARSARGVASSANVCTGVGCDDAFALVGARALLDDAAAVDVVVDVCDVAGVLEIVTLAVAGTSALDAAITSLSPLVVLLTVSTVIGVSRASALVCTHCDVDSGRVDTVVGNAAVVADDVVVSARVVRSCFHLMLACHTT